MAVIRTIVFLVLWVGLTAGLASLVLDGGVIVLGSIVIFVVLAFLIKSAGNSSSVLHEFRYRSKLTKRDVSIMRRDYDNDRRNTALGIGSDYWFDSYGYKRDPYTNAYLYMNSSNTPNGDEFAGTEGKMVEYDGGEVYADADGNFWRDE